MGRHGSNKKKGGNDVNTTKKRKSTEQYRKHDAHDALAMFQSLKKKILIREEL